ncbi:UNVERIFIED_CONTAM: hypothetical protein Slati_3498400 [Sesamum latifolium]|uniref:Endonuclease/exonuclease/phosphatase domain-containing protein n=1 Tax=Sesamum latifolium TaxID=2727402 RepID=A0AAW2UH32_9LAMI
MGPPWTVHTLKELVRVHRPSLDFISKTKCKARRCDGIKEAVNYFGLGVDSVGKGRGLLLLWRIDIDVWLQSFSNHHIDVKVKSEECPEHWCFNGLYGYAEVINPKEGWKLLRGLSQVSIRPWLCAGDFNEVLDQQEKQGTLLRAQWQIRDFRNCLQDCGLQDLGNQQRGSCFQWPRCLIKKLQGSDHAAVWVVLDGVMQSNSPRRTKRFHFEAAWCSAPECADVIQHTWSSVMVANSQASVLERIRATHVSLLRWNFGGFGNIRGKVRALEKRICDLRALSPSHDCKEEINRSRTSLEDWLGKEEILWKQMAKAH